MSNTNERADLIAELRGSADLLQIGKVEDWGGLAAEILQAADMLEADGKAQQVAVPSWKVGQALYNGADGTPPIFGRRWRLARDGFGLQRDDESGNYVQIDDAVSTMHAMLAAAQGAKP